MDHYKIDFQKKKKNLRESWLDFAVSFFNHHLLPHLE